MDSITGPRQPQFRPPRRTGGATTGGGGGGPPTGAAGGDLTGTYPNPTVAAGAVGNAEISDVAWSKVTGAPSSFPPSGTAGGDLSGTYPNPQIAAGTIVDADISATAAIQYSKLTGTPTSLPPSGTAGGDLTGTYPNPTIGALKVTDAKINDVAYSKVTGHPTSYPPSGAASGDLSGTYPGPTVAKLNGAALGTTTPLARGDILVADGTPALKRLALGAASTVLQSNGTDLVYGSSLGGPPSGAAGGDLQGTYPNPTIKPASLPWTPSQPTGGTLAPTDTTKIVTVPGSSSTGEAVRLGTRTIKQRLVPHPTNDTCYLTVNGALNAGATTWVQDDGTKPSWEAVLSSVSDNFFIQRQAAGVPGTTLTVFQVDNAGNATVTNNLTVGPLISILGATANEKGQINVWDDSGGPAIDIYANPGQAIAAKPIWYLRMSAGTQDVAQFIRRAPSGGAYLTAFNLTSVGDLTIAGNNATKNSGTAWISATSDGRTKRNVAPYPRGLAAILALVPKSWEYNGLGGSQDGTPDIGLVADDVEPIMPEMVRSRRGKLREDDAEETDILQLDLTALPLALVNAIKELAATVAALTERVAALEARA